MNVQVPIQSTTIGVTINRAPDAVALAGTMLPTDVTNLLTQLLNDPKYKFAEEPKK